HVRARRGRRAGGDAAPPQPRSVDPVAGRIGQWVKMRRQAAPSGPHSPTLEAAEGAPGAQRQSGRADVIVTESLTKVYPGGHAAVDGLDLRVRSGEIFALLGPNGAGKTTTVGMLTARVVPTSGRALVNGVDVAAHPGRAKAVIGV